MGRVKSGQDSHCTGKDHPIVPPVLDVQQILMSVKNLYIIIILRAYLCHLNYIVYIEFLGMQLTCKSNKMYFVLLRNFLRISLFQGIISH